MLIGFFVDPAIEALVLMREVALLLFALAFLKKFLTYTGATAKLESAMARLSMHRAELADRFAPSAAVNRSSSRESLGKRTSLQMDTPARRKSLAPRGSMAQRSSVKTQYRSRSTLAASAHSDLARPSCRAQDSPTWV